MMPPSFSRGQMIREASLTEADLVEIAKCRRDHNRLGFAYQIGFVRLFIGRQESNVSGIGSSEAWNRFRKNG
jgi:hypothetical protein